MAVPVAAGDAIVDVEWIAARVDDSGVRLVEVDVSRAAYDQGHIPGAVLWNAYADLRDGDYMPVGQVELGRLLSHSGISPETTVITYGYAAPLGFWLLKAHGHERVRMLMGSREQWTRNGHEWSTEVPELAESAHPGPVENAVLFASRPRPLCARVRRRALLALGRDRDTGRAGHIPGAISVPIELLRAEDGTLKSPDELRRVMEQAGVTKNKTVIAYCTIGNRASEAWFALTYLLGYPDTRVYYGSWAEWGKAIDTPVET